MIKHPDYESMPHEALIKQLHEWFVLPILLAKVNDDSGKFNKTLDEIASLYSKTMFSRCKSAALGLAFSLDRLVKAPYSDEYHTQLVSFHLNELAAAIRRDYELAGKIKKQIKALAPTLEITVAENSEAKKGVVLAVDTAMMIGAQIEAYACNLPNV